MPEPVSSTMATQPRTPLYVPEVAVIGFWSILLLVCLFAPAPFGFAGVGDFRIRSTIRLALLYYGMAVTLMLLLRPTAWTGAGKGRLARWCWTLSLLAYLVHLVMAFHFYHGWSHDHAIEHTRDVSGVGGGIYVSHLFTLLWTFDVAYWWLRPDHYAQRGRWIDAALHAFMAFIVFNGTVVYESGPIRWAGVALFAWLVGVVFYRWRRLAAAKAE